MKRKQFKRKQPPQRRSADAYKRHTLNRDQYKFAVRGVPLNGRGFRYGHLGANAHSLNFDRGNKNNARLRKRRTR